jgi:hypothetical protein
MKLVCVTCTQSVGCTFLDWSIHFLSGKTEFYNIAQGWIPLSQDPMTKVNAHGHEKNYKGGLAETQTMIHQLVNQNELVSCYPGPLAFEKAAAALDISMEDLTVSNLEKIAQHKEQDYNQLLNFANEQQAKIVFISLNDDLPMYLVNVRTLERMPFENRPADSVAEMQQSLDSVFFKDSLDTWNSLHLDNIWDVRERRALNTRPFGSIPLKVDFSFPHYWLDSQNWWYNGLEEMIKIMTWLDLDIDQIRFDKWIPIYRKWQKVQNAALQFQYNYKHIVDCIVNNWSYEIDLTFEQEVVVQHLLIHQHNLNLKTWQLEKFPNNTKDLHRLLEPNTHPLI